MNIISLRDLCYRLTAPAGADAGEYHKTASSAVLLHWKGAPYSLRAFTFYASLLLRNIGRVPINSTVHGQSRTSLELLINVMLSMLADRCSFLERRQHHSET